MFELQKTDRNLMRTTDLITQNDLFSLSQLFPTSGVTEMYGTQKEEFSILNSELKLNVCIALVPQKDS